MNILRKYNIGLSNIFIAILLFTLIILFFPKPSVSTSYDAGLRLCEALRISNGMELTWLNRGPIFPILISISFYLFGISVKSAFLMVRLFWVLNILLCFVLATKLYNKWVGLAASLLIMFSYGINLSGGLISQDIVMPVFLLLCVWIFYLACESKKIIYFIIAGIFLGIAFLVKESSLLYTLPAFFIFGHERYRKKEIVYGTIYYVAAFLLTVTPWAIFVYIKSQNLGLLLGAASPETVSAVVDEHGALHFIYETFIVHLFQNLFQSYKYIVSNRFVLAPIFPVVVVFLMIKTIVFKKHNDFYLLIITLAFFPILVVMGARGDRIGQAVIFFDLCYIGIAYLLYTVSKYVALKVNYIGVKNTNLVFLIATFLLVILLSIQFFNKKIPSKNILRSGLYGWHDMVYLGKDFDVKGRHNRYLMEGAEWIEGNAKEKATILSTSSIFNSIEFYTEFKYDNKPFSIFKSHMALKDSINKGLYKNSDRIVFIFPHQRFGRQSRRHQIVYFVFEKDFLNSLKTVKPDYIIVSIKESVFKLYLDEAPWAEKSFENDEVTIYKINDNEIMPLSGFRYVTSDVFKKKFNNFKAQYPDEHNDLESVLSYFDLKDADLIENSYENYQKEWVKENIPSGTGIAYSHGTGKCEIIEEGNYHITKFNKDGDLASFQATTDYLFIHNSRVRKNAFPLLFKELELIAPLKVFPQFFYFGDGWMIYKLKVR